MNLVSHPLTLVELVEHALNLYEQSVIEVEHLATTVRYVSEVLGHKSIAKEISSNPRKAVRYALKLIEMYCTPRGSMKGTIHVYLSLDDLANMVRELTEEGA